LIILRISIEIEKRCEEIFEEFLYKGLKNSVNKKSGKNVEKLKFDVLRSEKNLLLKFEVF
jgi:hypothetical protein